MQVQFLEGNIDIITRRTKRTQKYAWEFIQRMRKQFNNKNKVKISISAQLNKDDYRMKELNKTEQNRIELERTFKDHEVPLPDHFSTNKKLKYVIEGTVQGPLEN